MIELGVALTALSAISSAVSQGKELFEVGSQLDTFFNAQSKIQKATHDTKSKVWKDPELWSEFQANERLKREITTLREVMIYSGRPGLWGDWLQWQSDAKKRREEAEKELQRQAIKRQKVIGEAFHVFAITSISLLGIFSVLYVIVTY